MYKPLLHVSLIHLLQVYKPLLHVSLIYLTQVYKPLLHVAQVYKPLLCLSLVYLTEVYKPPLHVSFCTGTGQPRPPQSPAALQVGSGEPKASVLTWHLSMGACICSMKSPSGMHDPRGFESTCPGRSRFSTVVNSLERDGLRQVFLP